MGRIWFEHDIYECLMDYSNYLLHFGWIFDLII